MTSNLPLSVAIRPSWLKPSYEAIVVAAHSSQFPALDPAQTERLIVFTDWLAWQRWMRLGGHGLHFEAALQEWPDELGDPDTQYLRSCDWAFQKGRDLTLFEGVSLAHQFAWEAGGFSLSHGKLRLALQRLCHDYSPKRLVYLGARLEYGFLKGEHARNLVKGVAGKLGRAFEDISASSLLLKEVHPEVDYDREFAHESAWRVGLRLAAEQVVSAGFDFLNFFLPKRPHVFAVQNLALIKGLLAAAEDSQNVALTMLARHAPKNWKFLVSCWRAGARLVALPRAYLAGPDLSRLEEIRQNVEASWKTAQAANPEQEALRAFIRQMFLRADILADYALHITRLSKLFSWLKPSRLLVGDSENAFNRLALESGEKVGADGDELLNGMFLTRQRFDSRQGSTEERPLVKRLLAWGPQNERWHAVSAEKLDCKSVGYPAIWPLPSLAAKTSENRRVLFLPHTVDRSDVRGLYANIYSMMVEVLRALQAEGHREIRVKVHPGFHDKAYYDEILREFSIEGVELFKDGGLLPHIAWADLVVGPVNSGALVETLAMGRAYYPYMALPNSFDPALLPPMPIATSADEVVAHIRQGQNAELQRRVLSDLTGPTLDDMQVSISARNVWQALEQAIV
ncbi:MAG: hypothetical protein EPN26_14690 [Rhodospirillales bacterium]|nr:MAG: hypothetical protein EPN26_14690 [Rhodospirillales bacterium]